jgi:hypothetical protein
MVCDRGGPCLKLDSVAEYGTLCFGDLDLTWVELDI